MLTDKTDVRARPVPIALQRRSRVIACAVIAGAASLLHADPIPVQLVIDGGSAHLVRDGATFDVKGAGGDASLALLAGTGGNTARTWGVDSGTTAFLDQAHANGLAVSVGIWLGHTEQGFNYNNPSQVAAQLESARQAVLALRDHPAVLVWGIGNEMEGYGAGDDDAIWNAVEDIAAMVKSLDPNHPTMTTVAEIGGSRVAKIHALCPDIDIVGINTYGGVGSIPTRYRDAGGTKPYMVTEYAIWATYETGTTSWGAPWEPTSTVKGPVYANAYNTLHADSLCLGSIAFAWGDKREGTMTWNGMLLEDGSKLEVIDDLQAAWGGPALTNHCPRINAFSASGSNSLEQGDTLAVSLSATDPDGDALTYEYRLWDELGSGNPGDTQPTPPEYPASIL
ncbi:MAG: glycoside hydrolase family 2 TIM barrel-domain containing protein, partial [Phycisphaerales bacterium]